MMTDWSWQNALKRAVNVIVLSMTPWVWTRERSVTADNGMHIALGSAWQLLIEFPAPDGLEGKRASVDRVTEAVEVLGMRSAETERIGTAVLDALRMATQREERDQRNPPVSIRVWVPRVKASDLDGSGPDAHGVGGEKRRGWGFFLLERQEGGPKSPAGEAYHLVEVCLYQERQNAERHHDQRLCF